MKPLFRIWEKGQELGQEPKKSAYNKISKRITFNLWDLINLESQPALFRLDLSLYKSRDDTYLMQVISSAI